MMKYSIITDSNTNLSKALNDYSIIEINVDKYKKGKITYGIDLALNNSDGVIYLTNEENFATIKDIAEKELKVHDKIIIVADVNSAEIGKNNLALKVLRAADPVKVLAAEKTSYVELVSQDLMMEKTIINA